MIQESRVQGLFIFLKRLSLNMQYLKKSFPSIASCSIRIVVIFCFLPEAVQRLMFSIIPEVTAMAFN